MNKTIKKSDLPKYIREIPDFPKKGILFYDITTLLSHADALKKSIDFLVKEYKDKKVTKVIGIESRGFIFGTAVAYKLGVGFIPVRKKGKLPYKTKSVSYELEYGTDTLEIHKDAITSKDRVLIIDDLLATGGTVKGVAKLVKSFKSKIIGLGFIIELSFLDGRKKLKGLPVYSLIKY